MDVKNKYLCDLFKTYSRKYVIINDESSLNKIYELFKNNVIFDPLCDIEVFYLGRYYQINNNEKKMLKYFMISIYEYNNINTMIILSNIYRRINEKLSRYYFLMTRNRDCNFFSDYVVNMTLVNKLEFCINNMNNTSRRLLIDDFNYCAKRMCLMSSYEKNKMLQLAKEFEFLPIDNLEEELLKLLN